MVASTLFALMAISQTSDLPFLSPMFGSHMVMQRERGNPFWGWAKPGTEVKVTIGNTSWTAYADASGKWKTTVSPPAVGGPYEVRIAGGGEEILLEDVLVGDVWLCGGQSNMEMGMGSVNPEDASRADHLRMRLFTVGRAVGYQPAAVPSGGSWLVCTPENVLKNGWGGFSAVGYYFGKELLEEVDVPIGLVANPWGGTSAEAWGSADAMRPIDGFGRDLEVMAALKTQGFAPMGTYFDVWFAQNDKVSSATAFAGDEKFDDSDWETVSVPGPFPGGDETVDGVAWYRTTFTLPDPLPEGGMTLHLGSVRQFDWTYVNGRSMGYNGGFDPTVVWLWPGSVVPGKNSLAVRVYQDGEMNGFASDASEIYVELGDGTRISLAGEWRGKMGALLGAGDARPKNTEVNPTLPSTLYNGMLAPIAPMAIKGAIWYQGETNGGRGFQYRTVLPAMIGSWRRAFGQGDFPFYIVSLANWLQHPQQPGDDGWAELREAQALTAATVPNSGLAVTVDVGEADDIHPKDKKSVGHRLALLALAKDYGEDVVFSGPVYRSMSVAGNKVYLAFDHVVGGLELKEMARSGFAVAGEDRQWKWAQAEVSDGTVVVWSDEVAKPVAVRYAWAMNPYATLFNSEGLPAVPFRTDDWPMVSRNNK